MARARSEASHPGAAGYVGDYEGEHYQCRDREGATGAAEHYGGGRKDVDQPPNWNNPQSIIKMFLAQ